jgi:hypothetical protein
MLAFIYLVLLSTFSFAGDRAGNGGDVVICGNEVVTLDYFEASRRDIKIDLPTGNLEEKAFFLLERYRRIDPISAEFAEQTLTELLLDATSYQANKNEFQVWTHFTNDELSDVNDSFELTLPKTCKIKQLIIYNLKAFSFTKKFIINADLWDLLDDNQKALAIFHETLYVQHAMAGWMDSRFSRYLNSILSSDKFAKYSLEAYFSDISLSQNSLEPFIYVHNWESASDWSKPPTLILPGKDAKVKCRSTYTPTAACYKTSLAHYRQAQKETPKYLMWNGYHHLVPATVVVDSDKVIGFEAVFTDRFQTPASVLRVNSTTLLRWHSYYSLERIFENLTNLRDFPLCFVDINGDVKNIYHLDRVISL